MWPRTMTALTGQIDRKGICRRHDRPRRGVKPAKLQTRCIVDRVDLIDVKAVHHPFLHHHLAAAAGFLGRLEQQGHAAFEVAGLSQVFGRPQQHRRMTVMAAGMHLARMGAGVGHAGFFGDGQRIHIRTQAHRGPLALTIDDRDDAGLGDPLVQLIDAEFAQTRRDIGRGLMALQPQFGDRVQMLAPFGHIGTEIGDAVDNRHGVDSLAKKMNFAI